jgi:O-succinylbenzoate synthase
VREGLLVRVGRADGRAGYGEAAPVPGFGAESVDADEAAARALGEFMEVEDAEGGAETGGQTDAAADTIVAQAAALPKSLPQSGRGEAADPFQPAATEQGRRAQPVFAAAAWAARLPCLANALSEASRGAASLPETNARAADADSANASPAHASLGVAALLPAGRAALAVAPGRVELGFRTFKWKVGVGEVVDELGLLDDLCALLPETARLRLDANGSWEPRQAERWLARCAERPIEFVEQPIARDARGAQDRLLGLAQDYPVPLALDESIASSGDVEAWLGAGWPGVWVIKPSLLADPAAVLARLAAARADLVFSSALETGVGARAALRHAFDWRGAGPAGAPRALGFGVTPLFADGRFDGPPAVPVLRWSDVERIDPEAVWNAAN